MAATDWKPSASDNTTIGGIFTGLNMARGDVGASIRQMRADLVNEGQAIIAGLSSRSGFVSGVSIATATSDNATALQAAIDQVSTDGGGTIIFPRGATIKAYAEIILKPYVTVDLNGSTLEVHLVADGTNNINAVGVRIRSNTCIQNGTVSVKSSGTGISSQVGGHAPIVAGSLYSQGGTIASPSDNNSPTGWAIRNVTVVSDKDILVPAAGAIPAYNIGAAGIAVIGDASDGIIEGITVPDSAVMAGGILMDWGAVGGINSSDVAASRTAFNASTAKTTHPNNIKVRDVTIGTLSRSYVTTNTGSYGVRLSGVFDIVVERVRAKTTTTAFLLHTAGDLGFEFADALVKRHACRGIAFRDCLVESALSGNLIYADTYADNIGRAVTDTGYSPLIDPLISGNVSFENVTGFGPNDVTAIDGIKFVHARGVRAIACEASYFRVGALMDENVTECLFDRCRTHHNREDGVKLEHVTTGPARCGVSNAVSYLNGSSGSGFANILVGKATDTRIDGGAIGATTGETASYGIKVKQVSDGSLRTIISGQPSIESHYAGGAALNLGADESWGCIKLFEGARFGAGVVTRYIGLSIVPVRIDSDVNGDRITYRSARGKLSADTTPPAAFPANTGDVILYNDPTALLSKTVCRVAGTPGTWNASA